GPMGPGEGILYGDINLNEIVTRKVIQDFAGHYNRPDLFTLTLNSSSPSLFRTTESSSQTQPEKGTNKPNSPEESVLVSAKLQGRSGNH
ncbi:MAG: hypothetical protein Q8S00_04170, partial [Deltaproteobacteria bacterium]|nr:hypothetical protein [Deltaproteobacteria bacterium]